MSQDQPYPGPPYPGQPYPGQPYPGQPYPGQPYPGQPYPGQPYGWAPPPAARRKHWKWIVPVVVAAAIVLGLGIYLVARDPHPEDAKTAGRQLRLPAAVHAYTRLRGYDTGLIKDRMVSLAGSLGTTGDKLVDSSVVGAYATSASAKTPELLLIAFPLRSVPDLRDEVRDEGSAGATGKLMSSVAAAGKATPHTVDPGKLGGAMRCLQVEETGSQLGYCGWVDRSYMAMTIVRSPGSDDNLDRLALDLRTAAEH